METEVKSEGFTAIAVKEIPKGNTRLGKIYRRFTDNEACAVQMVEFRREGYEGVSAVRVAFPSTVIRPQAETWLDLQKQRSARNDYRFRYTDVAIPSLIFINEDGNILWADYCLRSVAQDGTVTEEVKTGDKYSVRTASEIERWIQKGYYHVLLNEITAMRREEYEAEERQRRIAEAQLTPIPHETQRVIDRVQRWVDDHDKKSSPKTEADAFNVFSVSDTVNYSVSLIAKSLCESFLRYAGTVKARTNYAHPVFHVDGTQYERYTVAEAYAEVVRGYLSYTYKHLALSGQVLQMFNEAISY